jgi:hypothetical protein
VLLSEDALVVVCGNSEPFDRLIYSQDLDVALTMCVNNANMVANCECTMGSSGVLYKSRIFLELS